MLKTFLTFMYRYNFVNVSNFYCFCRSPSNATLTVEFDEAGNCNHYGEAEVSHNLKKYCCSLHMVCQT